MKCICSKCHRLFLLSSGDDEDNSLENTEISLNSGDSCGVYAAYVECPYCGHEHDITV